VTAWGRTFWEVDLVIVRKAILLLLVLGSCSSPGRAEGSDDERLRIIVREVQHQATQTPEGGGAVGRPLTAEEIEALLGRVEPLPAVPTADASFTVLGSRARPRGTDAAVDAPFPPARGQRAEVPHADGAEESGVLEVLRFAPDGVVDREAVVSVTFSQPMVGVGEQARVGIPTPARLEPELPGTWQWLGTRTLVFEPAESLPPASRFEVTVPASTQSMRGEELAEDVTFGFSTPPPRLRSGSPTGTVQDRSPVVFLVFDQVVVGSQAAERIELVGERSHELRPATTEEIRQEEEPDWFDRRYGAGRWIALEPVEPLPLATEFKVTVAPVPGVPDAPLREREDDSFTFTTFGPLEIVAHHGMYESESSACPVVSPWEIVLNNPLDPDRPPTVSVRPELPGLEITVEGNKLIVDGERDRETTYTVTVHGGLRDVHGQTLGRSRQVVFRTIPSRRYLAGPRGELITLDPAGPATVPVYTVNHDSLRVRIHRVDDVMGDWETWLRFFHTTAHPRQWDDRPPLPPLPGTVLFDAEVDIVGALDDLAETPVDLSPYLVDGHGQFMLWIEPTDQDESSRRIDEVVAWVQVTDLGLTAFSDQDQLLIWVTDLATGQPLEGVPVDLLPGAEPGVPSDAAGWVRIERPGLEKLAVARRGTDVAILPEFDMSWTDHCHWHRYYDRPPRQIWFVMDDRGLYRPGETVHLKGWLRNRNRETDEVTPRIEGLPEEVQWRLWQPTAYGDDPPADLARGDAAVGDLGGFSVELELPADMEPGDAHLTFWPAGVENPGWAERHVHDFRVEAMRNPEFTVALSAGPGPVVAGEEVVVGATTSYFSGGGLPGAYTYWRLTARGTRYHPPGHEDYGFGFTQLGRVDGPSMGFLGSKGLSGRTDAAGEHQIAVSLADLDPMVPVAVEVQVTVADVNRQRWAATERLVVHPAQLYVGLKPVRDVVVEGEPVELDVIVVDLDGVPVPGIDVELSMARRQWKISDGRRVVFETDPMESRTTSEDVARRVSFVPAGPGVQIIEAAVVDAHGRRAATGMRVWVAGASVPSGLGADAAEVAVTLVPEDAEVQPGDVARIHVTAPFYPAHGVVTVRQRNVLTFETLELLEPSTVVELDVQQRHLPQFTVQVDLVGSRIGDDGRLHVAHATGEVTLHVPPSDHRLDVEVAPRDEVVEPGGRTEIAVVVTDRSGEPVAGAEVAVFVVDEAVHAVSGYELRHPLDAMYTPSACYVDDFRGREYVASFDQEAARARARDRESTHYYYQLHPEHAHRYCIIDDGSDGDEGDYSTPVSALPIRVRGDFDPVALFVPAATTDEQGRVRVPVELPDSLTRYRVMAVVATVEDFGAGEDSITARLPLMVRPSPPRFVAAVDRFELPVVLHNHTGDPLDVALAVHGDNAVFAEALDRLEPGAVAGDNTSGVALTVPPHDRMEVRFPAAAVQTGTARFQAVAAAGVYADASTFELPVKAPLPLESYATYGTLDGGSLAYDLGLPADAWEGFGGLEIDLSPSRQGELVDARRYLRRYPFACSEQIASRVLALAGPRHPAARQGPGTSARGLRRALDQDLAEIVARHNDDGGWPLWARGHDSLPFLSVHVTHALVRARERGHDVPDATLVQATAYLANIDGHLPGTLSPRTRWTIRAYALNVRFRHDGTGTDAAAALLAEVGVEDLPEEAMGWLLPVLAGGGEADAAARIRQQLRDTVTETADTAHFDSGYGRDGFRVFHGSFRADAVILESLIDVDPDSDLIPKLARGLLASRVDGRWLNTQDTGFVTRALTRYFETHQGHRPRFVTRVWIGDRFAGKRAFRPARLESARIRVPLATLAETPDGQQLTLAMKGKGRLHYRIGIEFAPLDPGQPPLDRGFGIEREYRALDDPEDVRQGADGTWHIRAGARVQVRLVLDSSSHHHHVALVDPLPAGLEPVNLALEGTGRADRSNEWWWRYWYDHEAMHDDRVEVFAEQLWEGAVVYTYIAEATTPGIFVAPAARAEEMYRPEIFGRTGTGWVVIE